MGTGYVVSKDSNKRPRAMVQKVRGEKLVQRLVRFESIFGEEYEKYLKAHGGVAPDLYEMKKLLSVRLEYGENWISQLLNILYFEAATGRHPLFKLDRMVYLVRK